MKSLLVVTALLLNTLTAHADFGGGPSIDAGFAGYCLFQPNIAKLFGAKEAYSDTIFGPTSHGWSPYNYECTPVDLREQKVTETFDLLAGDEVMTLRVHFVLRVAPNEKAVKTVVEKYGAQPQQWYNVIQESLRTIVRAVVESKNAAELNAQRGAVGDQISSATHAFLAERPIELAALEVGQVEYPPSVKQAIEKKMAKVYELDAANKQVEIASAEGRSKVETAKAEANAARERAYGEADATKAMKSQITELYVEYLNAQAKLEAAKQAGNKTVFFFGDEKKPAVTYDVSGEAGAPQNK